jgi:hypothetical protein
VAGNRTYMAVYGDVGAPYRVSCLDTGKLYWQASVWGNSLGLLCATPFFKQCVTFVLTDRWLLVFGAGQEGFHVEAFRTDNGTNIFRVSNYLSGK